MEQGIPLRGGYMYKTVLVHLVPSISKVWQKSQNI